MDSSSSEAAEAPHRRRFIAGPDGRTVEVPQADEERRPELEREHEEFPRRIRRELRIPESPVR